MSLTTNIDNIYKKGVIGNVRKAQEDSHDIFLKTPNGDVFVVCDGMGGHVGGAVASATAVNSIKEYLEKEKYPKPIDALNGALQFANMQILGYANEHPELKGMGTTACILMFQGNDAWIAHVGDSRIYLFLGKEKQLHRITKDHSYVQSLVEAGQITDEEAEHHPNKNRILKALGILPEVEPTFNFESLPIHPKNGDVFLICSDGLSGMIPDSTIERVLAEKDLSLAQKGNSLIDLAMKGETVQPGGQDNCTLELIQVDNSPWKESEFKSYNPDRELRVPKESVSDELVPDLPHKPFSAKLIAAVIVAVLLFGFSGWLIWHQSVNKKVLRLEKECETIERLIESVNDYNKTVKEKIRDDSIKKSDWEERLIIKYKNINDTLQQSAVYWVNYYSTELQRNNNVLDSSISVRDSLINVKNDCQRKLEELEKNNVKGKKGSLKKLKIERKRRSKDSDNNKKMV